MKLKHVISIGQRFGLWTITAGPILKRDRKQVRRYYNCRCDCGVESLVWKDNLVHEHSTSCGCAARKASAERAYIHGQTYTKEYQAWTHMRARVRPNYIRHENYYDRGIRVCAGLNDRETFLKVLGQMPTDKVTVDRIDNDSGYWDGTCDECKAAGRPLNVQWASYSEQRKNSRPAVMSSNVSHTKQVRQIVNEILATKHHEQSI